jgi:hypothetical protein
MEEGRKDKAEGLIREQQELMEKLNRMNSEGPSKGTSKGPSKGHGPSPEQMEKFAWAMQQVQHLRIASEHLKLAGMHDMAMDLMRRAEDIEQDLRNAKEKMAEQMRGPKDQPQRDQPQRDQPQRERPEARGNSVDAQLEQLRNENRELRMMVERIAQELRKDRD